MGILGGQEKRELSFAGPLFTTCPKNLPPTTTPSFQLPSRPHHKAISIPDPSTYTYTKATNTTLPDKHMPNTRGTLLDKAKESTKRFVGKYMFGRNGIQTEGLPPTHTATTNTQTHGIHPR